MRAYARALVATVSAQELPSVEAALLEFSSLWKQVPDLRTVMTSPGVSHEEREKILKALLSKILSGVPASVATSEAVLLRLFSLMARRRRLGQMRALAEMVAVLRVEQDGGIAGQVEVAQLPSAEERERLAATLEKMFASRLGKGTSLTWLERPDLLAGLRVKIDGRTYDGSLRGHLDRLKRSLFDGAEALGK